MKPLNKSKRFIERHIINPGEKPVIVKKVYVKETLIEDQPANLEEWFKKGLGAKKILKYEKDECSFRWVVWYI